MRIAILIGVLSFVGCIKSVPIMVDVSAPRELKPEAGKALVVFVRHSSYPPYALPVLDGSQNLVNLLGACYAAVNVEPGKHDFIVFAGNADLVRTELAAGKVYVIEVIGTPGAMGANFNFTASVKGGDKWPYPRKELAELPMRIANASVEAQQARVEAQAEFDGWKFKGEKLKEASDNYAGYKGEELRDNTISAADGIDQL